MAKKGLQFKKRLLFVGMLLTSIAVLPSTVLLFFGMLPTIMARFTDTSRQRNRVLTIGFMNFAGCFPFWIKLMQQGHKFDQAINILMDPLHIIIMYGGAFMGYMIEWGLSSIVSVLMVQKGKSRLEQIKKMQKELIARWGPEVSGDTPLDRFGFPADE